jgi:exodeoxyribonuclease V gamma subunit
MVLHGNRLEDLRDLLVEVLRKHPLPPLVPEVILVQSNGMKHWLEMALADDAALGICAATQLDLPASYLWQVYRTVLGAQAVPQHMPFDKSSLVWRLVRLLPDLVKSHDVYAPLQHYLGTHPDGRRLYQLALQLADVLDGYQSYRADWLADWAQGTIGQDLMRDHTGRALSLDAAHAWQAQLWRDIRADIGAQQADASRASVHARFMAALQAQYPGEGAHPAGLPQRIVVFGISSLPMQTVEALAALGQFCQVLMLVQNPCQHYWGDIVQGHSTALHTASHPLLASWGKQGRDYLHLLDGFDQPERYRDHFTRIEVFVDPAAGQAQPTQLQQLQSAVLHLHDVPQVPQPLLVDDSIQLITTHSAQREVEVLHDALWHWLDADSTLAPSNVMVMVPDMAVFAPHIQAVFGRFAAGHSRHIPFSVADTTPRQSPLVQALEQLLALPRARVSLADWFSLFEVAAVRKRFGLAPAQVAQLGQWLAEAGVRWGLDAKHRMAWGLAVGVDGLDQNTWAFGLRRLLLGYAVGNGTPWGGTLPQGALGSLDAPLMGAVQQWLHAMECTLSELNREQTPAQWVATLDGIVQRFFLAEDDAQDRFIQRCLAPLDAWLQTCEEAQLTSPLSLDVVHAHWMAQLESMGLQQRFFGGGVQFGTLMPMRSIPFRVVCLLGMNDGDYPRQQAPHDFDLMAHSWRAGDRSRREDDRYLFLEAVLSAREKLYISWQGHRATDNVEQPPSVLVAQLMDYLHAGWTPARPPEKQPLQAFSEAYFLQGSGFQTYDADWERVHATKAGDALAAAPAPAPAPALAALTLADLRQLLRQPVEVFLRKRLQVLLDDVDAAAIVDEPFALDALEQYQLSQTLLEAPDLDNATAQLALTGKLPMAAFGRQEAAALRHKTRQVQDRRASWLQTYTQEAPAQSIALQIDGVDISGVLQGLRCNAQGTYLQLQQRVGAVLTGSAKAQAPRGHVLVGLWVHHLAACASGLALTSVQIGLDGEVVLDPLLPDEANAILQSMVTSYAAAWEQPLPVACKTAWAYLQCELQNQRQANENPDKAAKDPHTEAQNTFDGDYQRTGERDESAYLARVFESYADIEQTLPSWAHTLYGALAQHARVGQAQGVPA